MNSWLHKRQQILQQMEQIECMAHGSLQTEPRPSLRQPGQERGPYFKHQIWADGKNLTRRVAPAQAEALAQAIEGRKEFEKLAGEYVQATVGLTRSATTPGAKKNAPKSTRPSTRKPPATSRSS